MTARGRQLVEVAHARPDPTGRYDVLLSPAELDRAAAFGDRAERARFATGRALLRALLAARTGRRPAEIELDDRCPGCGRAHGKPRAVGLDDSPHTSVSHAGTRVLVALGRQSVGIDVEAVAATGFESFAMIALTDAERSELGGRPEADRAVAGADAWVQKEALLKLHEFGLARSPNEIELGLSAADRVVPDPIHSGSTVALVQVPVGPGYRAWLAMDAPALPRVETISGAELLAAAEGAARSATR